MAGRDRNEMVGDVFRPREQPRPDPAEGHPARLESRPGAVARTTPVGAFRAGELRRPPPSVDLASARRRLWTALMLAWALFIGALVLLDRLV